MNKNNRDSNDNLNPVGLLVHVVAVVLFCHAALSYIGFPGYLDNWVPSLVSVFLPIINIFFGAYYGLMGYWEINWLFTSLILLLGFGALIPKALGYIFSVLFITTTVSVIYSTDPDPSDIPDGEGAIEVVYARANKEVSHPRGMNSKEGIETLLEYARIYRSRCLRNDQQRCAANLKLMMDTAKHQLSDPRLN